MSVTIYYDLLDETATGAIDGLLRHTGYASLFSCGTPSIWHYNTPCCFHGRRCPLGTACPFPTQAVSSHKEWRNDFDTQLKVLRSKQQHCHSLVTMPSLYSSYRELAPMLVDPFSGFRLSMRMCSKKSQCLDDLCSHLHSVDEVLSLFARDAVAAFYRRAALLPPHTILSSSSSTVHRTLYRETPRHFKVRPRDEFLLHATEEMCARCPMHAGVHAASILTMERFTLDFAVSLCNRHAELIHPVCVLTCPKCDLSARIHVYI